MYDSIDEIGSAARNSAMALKIHNLEVALESNRQIGVAIGILMTRRLITEEAAFELLSKASQHQQRKLREVAGDVVQTGELEP